MSVRCNSDGKTHPYRNLHETTFGESMDRPKIVAIIAGAISITLAIAYLLLVQILDFRGEMIPAPQSYLPTHVEVAQIPVDV